MAADSFMRAQPTATPRMHRGDLARRARQVLPIVAVTLTTSASLTASVSAAPIARSSRTISISETGKLHLTSHKGFTLNERGSATGTIKGTIYIHLHITSTNHVSAEVNIYPSGSSITGTASASYRSSGAVATFSGTMTVARGSGSYSHAHGSGLSFSGTVQRSNDAVTVHVSGRITT